MLIGTYLGWGNIAIIVLAIALAFIFGYSLTILPILRSGVEPRVAIRLAFLSDTASITSMEIVDHLIIEKAQVEGVSRAVIAFAPAPGLMSCALRTIRTPFIPTR